MSPAAERLTFKDKDPNCVHQESNDTDNQNQSRIIHLLWTETSLNSVHENSKTERQEEYAID